MKHRLLLFSRAPLRGAVKTRLVPPLDEDGALELYLAFLADQLAFARGFAAEGVEVELSTDEPWDPGPAFAPLLDGVRRSLQGPGDLGERMGRAFGLAHGDGRRGAVILATDAPTLPASRIRAAFAALDSGADAVVAPAADGGYVLLGMGRPHPPLLERVPWGGPGVMETTRRRAAEHDLALAELAPWHDVDQPGQLAALREELRDPAAARRAPATARCVAALFP